MIKQLVYLIIICFSFIGTAQNETLFDKANTFYKDGNYNDAIASYEQILKSKSHSAEVYFNLGNAYYKLNNIAKSIYNYEMALSLKPGDKDIQQNLEFANKMKIDAIEPLPEMGYKKYFNSFSSAFKTDTLAIAAVCFFVLFSIGLISYFFTYKTKTKRLLFISAFTSVLLAVFTLSMAYYKNNLEISSTYAIVYAEVTNVNVEPNLKSDLAFVLHEGTKVKVLETVDNWKKIRLADGKNGWILNEDIKLLEKF